MYITIQERSARTAISIKSSGASAVVFATRKMTYNEGLALVKTEYETIKDSTYNEIIITGLTYDGCNGFCVSVYNKDGEAIITDLGETSHFFDEITEEEWIKDCTEHGFEFNHWRIERKLSSIDDVYDFINFIDFISDREFNK